MNLLAQQVTPFSVNSAATTNATAINAKPTRLVSLVASNINAAARFVKLYDKATAPVVGTDVPLVTIPIPAGGSVSLALGAIGMQLNNGLALAITTLGTDADATAVAAGEVKVAGGYAT